MKYRAGVTLYNFLRSIPAPVDMHNMGNVDSIGNAIFLAGRHRYACAHSTFMFHGVGIAAQNNMRIEERNARDLLHSILADQGRISDIIVDRTNISPSGARKLFRETRTKDANGALEAGIIQGISNPTIPLGADMISLVLGP